MNEKIQQAVILALKTAWFQQLRERQIIHQPFSAVIIRAHLRIGIK